MSSGRHRFEVVTAPREGGWQWCISCGTENNCWDIECGYAETRAEAKKRAAAAKRQYDSAYRAAGWEGVQDVMRNRNAQGHWRRLARRRARRGKQGE